jgi:hypothetical protein
MLGNRNPEKNLKKVLTFPSKCAIIKARNEGRGAKPESPRR